MRIDFISRLALLLLAGFLLIATQVWAMGTVEWLFIVGGIVMIALAAGALGAAGRPAAHPRRLPRRPRRVEHRPGDRLRRLDPRVGRRSRRRWSAAALATVGLTIHEVTTERVVHELSVIGTEERTRRPVGA